MRNISFVLFGLVTLSLLGGCDMLDDNSAPEAAAPQPYSHGPLSYKVKVKYQVNFTYTPKDADDAPEYVIQKFESRLEADGNGGNGFEMAEGETPNLTLMITVNSDTSDNKTMAIHGYVSDGDFYTSTDNSYQDPGVMINAMADTVNGFCSGGWSGTR